jgi:hypothetical protein
MERQELSRALCVTATSGNEKSLLLLLQAGADVDYDEPSFGSPLDLSLASKRDDLVLILLRHGAKVHKGDRKRSPLVAATTYASLDSLHLLLSHGAAVAECESSNLNGGTSVGILGTHALAAARGRNVAFMETLLAVAERQRLPFQYYMTAHLLAVLWRKAQHAQLLESTIARQFNGRRPIAFGVKTLYGRTIQIEMYAEALIGDLKDLIHGREGPPPDQIFLSNGSRILRDNHTLSDYMIQRGVTIHMLLRMRWGGLPGG